jgi:predicted DNA-binding transcriptional regulator AlpA
MEAIGNGGGVRMATKAKGKVRKNVQERIDGLPNMITHRDVAEKMGISTETLREWVESSEFPIPHSVIRQTFFYRLDIIQVFLETGKWPTEVKFRRPRSLLS